MGLFGPRWMKDWKETAKLTDTVQLFRAAMESSNADVVATAVNKLNNDELLLQFIRERKDAPPAKKYSNAQPYTFRGERFMAVDRIQNQDILLNIAEHEYVKPYMVNGVWQHDFQERALSRVYDTDAMRRCKARRDAKRSPNQLDGFLDSHLKDMLKLADGLPTDPEGQRAYINDIQAPGLVRKCCILIEPLRPYAELVGKVLDTAVLTCDLTLPKPVSVYQHDNDCKEWKKAAEEIIALAAEKPEVFYPVKDKLAAAINGAEARIIRKTGGKVQVGTKTVTRRVASDAPDDWTETVVVPTYVDTTSKNIERKPMGLHYPA